MASFFEFDGFPLLHLENLEGNFVEKYSEKNMKLKQDVFGVNLQIGLPTTPAQDPRTGVFGPDFAATGFYSAGYAFYQKQEYEKAIANLSIAIEIKPSHFFAFKLRGMAHYEKKEYDLSIADFTEAIQRDPLNIGKLNKMDLKTIPEDQLKACLAEEYNGRGNAYDEKGEYDKAIADYDESP